MIIIFEKVMNIRADKKFEPLLTYIFLGFDVSVFYSRVGSSLHHSKSRQSSFECCCYDSQING